MTDPASPGRIQAFFDSTAASITAQGIWTVGAMLAASAAAVVGAAWWAAEALIAPVPRYVAAAAAFGGLTLGLGILAVRERLAQRVQPDEQRALVTLQLAGGEMYADNLRNQLDLRPAAFDLLLHSLRKHGFIFDSEHDSMVFYADFHPPRKVSLMAPGRDYLLRLHRADPSLFAKS